MSRRYSCTRGDGQQGVCVSMQEMIVKLRPRQRPKAGERIRCRGCGREDDGRAGRKGRGGGGQRVAKGCFALPEKRDGAPDAAYVPRRRRTAAVLGCADCRAKRGGTNCGTGNGAERGVPRRMLR